MKVALCISGHIRTFEDIYSGLKQYVLDEFNPDVFLSTYDTMGYRYPNTAVIEEKGQQRSIDYETAKIDATKIIQVLNPVSIIVDHWPKIIPHMFVKAEQILNKKKWSPKPEAIYSMHYKIFQCNELKKMYENMSGEKYDIVIRTRPDIGYTSSLKLWYENQPKDKLITEQHGLSCGIADDTFAIGPSYLLDEYCQIYNMTEQFYMQYVPNSNPHELLKAFLNTKISEKWIQIPHIPIYLKTT
jgi:hypothetical protein